MRFFFTNKKTFYVTLFVLFFTVNKSSAQAIDSILNIYANVYQQEKVYIQFDKPAYAPGETVWFKAYLMAGIYPSDISKNFYVDWSDETGKVLTHTSTPILHESARGQFEIPANFTGNTLYLKAYTKWMLNFDSAFLYQKLVRIIQKNTAKKVAEPIAASIQFFPESGDAVAGIKNKIAFKANDQFGRPVKVKGVILNNKGLTIDSFKAMHDGMGYFFLEPKLNESYTAKWIDEQKVIHQTALPQIKSEGADLKINIADSSRDFLISRSENPPENLQQLHIIATEQQQLVYMANANLSVQNYIRGSIPVAQLPTGVLQITLFDKNWVPLAERISFINNKDAEFSPEVGFSVLGLEKRGRNVLVINVPDSVASNFSVAVTDAGIGVDTTDNIISHLLLTGDLRGAVYNPLYYFSDDKDAQKNLDLVMLTHGWRRFNWQNVVAGKMPDLKYPKDLTYLNFSGKIFGASSSQLRDAKYIFTIIRAKDSSQHTFTIPLQSNGTFYKPELVFYDTLKVYYQFPSPDMSDMTAVTFFNGLLDAPSHLYVDNISANCVTSLDTGGTYRNFYLAQEEQRLKLLSQTGLLKEVIVKTREKSPLEKLDEKYTSGLFAGQMDVIPFDILDDKAAFGYPNLLTYLQGKVAGLQITVNGTDATVQWRGGTPTIYLNEMPVDVSQIQNISMTDVAYVKVFRPPFTGDINGSGGAIAVYLKKGNDKTVDTKSKGIPYAYVAGYTPIKEFYSPNYGTYDQKNEATDVRSTLYWNPLIFTTQQKHTMHFEFYNNDVTHSFRVVLEGITKDGRLAHVEKVVE